MESTATSPLHNADFLFMRHAQSVDNEHMRIPFGKTCGGLTALGCRQVMETGEHLLQMDVRPALILCSPVARAKSSADIIADMLGIPLKTVPELVEQGLGAWEGQPWKHIEPFFETRANPPEGEHYDAFYERMRQALDVIAAEKTGPLLIVSHGGVWHGMRALYNDHATDWLPNAGLGRIILKGNAAEFSRVFAPQRHVVMHGAPAAVTPE